MLQLVVTVREIPAGLECSAMLVDRLDSGVSNLVASHGPIPRRTVDAREEGLMGLLQAGERYWSLLEYGARVDGTLDNSLF